MAVLHRKEEKIQATLGRLPKKYTHEQFVEMFIKLYSKDWGKIKSAYIKQSQDKEPGTIINMPKPDVYLKQILTSYLQQADLPKAIEEKQKPLTVEEEVVELKKPKIVAKKKAVVVSEVAAGAEKIKTLAKKKTGVTETPAAGEKKANTASKKAGAVTKPKAITKKKILPEEEVALGSKEPAAKKPIAKNKN